MPMLKPSTPIDQLERIRADVDGLLHGLQEAESAWAPWTETVSPENRRSARNLAHYWSIRQHDLRDLQARLADFGLSSLGRCESHVKHTLQLVASALEAIQGGSYQPPAADDVVRVDEGAELLRRRATDLLGAPPADRSVRIMVTLPSHAATDPNFVSDLIKRGMSLARINCAHDEADDWRAMARHVRSAAKALGKPCAVAMDLAGPKLRTGPLDGGDRFRLGDGDVLRLTRDCSPAPVDGDSPRIGCTLPEVFDHIEVGHRVFFDDGKIGGAVQSVVPEAIDVRIDHPTGRNAKLKAGKGINVPDTDLPISALTDKDLDDLRTVVELADIVELSFVREPADVQRLLDELDRLDAAQLGIVLKIETRPAFEQLPQLVMTAMKRPRVGVMIARGDLAVEVGYERMAELQEEMLWLCESAHLPVIWATQVLEQLAKKGQPSRAEVSDAAMSGRSECVMLNKGPHIDEAVTALDNILSRMGAHLYKKNTLLRTLRSWDPKRDVPDAPTASIVKASA